MVKLESVLYSLCVGNVDDPAVSSGYWSLLSEGSFLEVPILEFLEDSNSNLFIVNCEHFSGLLIS